MLIAIGVFFLLLLNVQWEQVPVLVRAYSVLGAGLVCLAAFATVQGATGDGAIVGSEVAHQVAGGVAAAVILGSIFASLGGFPFWGLFDEGRGEAASRALEIDTQVLPGDAAVISFDLINVDLELLTWDRPEMGINGTISVYGISVEKAREYLNKTEVGIERGSSGDVPTFALEVDQPEDAGRLGYRGYKLFLTLRIPRNVRADLDLATVSGDYSISNALFGDAFLKTVSGKIEVEGITGQEIIISTVSGEINGSITSDEAVLKTISGDISVDLGESSGTYEAKSTSGNIRFGLPLNQEVGTSLDASTTTGSVHLDLEDLDFEVDHRNEKVAETPGFSAKEIQISLEASTISGDIRVEL